MNLRALKPFLPLADGFTGLSLIRNMPTKSDKSKASLFPPPERYVSHIPFF
ncbi:MAG: hypothetical protein VW397_04675 [Candidatus Margulisiibacteriota bacterium]